MLFRQCFKALRIVTDSSLKNKKHFSPESLCFPSNTWKRPISHFCSITIILNIISYLDILKLSAQARAQLATDLLLQANDKKQGCQSILSGNKSRLIFMTAHLCWVDCVIDCSPHFWWSAREVRKETCRVLNVNSVLPQSSRGVISEFTGWMNREQVKLLHSDGFFSAFPQDVQ